MKRFLYAPKNTKEIRTIGKWWGRMWERGFGQNIYQCNKNEKKEAKKT